mgnify:FL=1
MTEGQISSSTKSDGRYLQEDKTMSFRDEIRAHLTETGESKRALSLRAGLNAKAIGDILSIEGLKPRHSTLAAI